VAQEDLLCPWLGRQSTARLARGTVGWRDYSLARPSELDTRGLRETSD